MVLSPPPLNAGNGTPRPDWLERLRHILSLSDRGIMVLVDRACDAQLGMLVRRLLPDYPDLEVHVKAGELDSVPPGSVVVYQPQTREMTALNLGRSLVADHQLKLILWCDTERTAELA